MICNLCPRKCNANRSEDEGNGYCKMPILPVVAKASLHFWEEPCISGQRGSGTVFFSGCSLGCVFCQNYEISHKNKGKIISVERLAKIFKELELQGAENINLVNPTHFVKCIESALKIYKPGIPIVYNSGGYESDETISIALKICDIFLMDIKYCSNNRSDKYSLCNDYFKYATNAIMQIVNKNVLNIFDERGVMKSGLIIRHLVLPQGTNDAIDIIKWVDEHVPNAVLSLMSQYTPFGNIKQFPEINRKITKREYDKVLHFAESTNIDMIYTQKLLSSSEEYIPSFDFTGV